MAKKASRRGLTGITAIVLLVVVGIAVTVYLVGRQQDTRSRASEFRNVRQDNTQSPGQQCAQVLTPARNTQTNTCRTFPTSCLPSGWTKDPSCQAQESQGDTTSSTLCDIDSNGTSNLADFSLLVQCVQGGQLCTASIKNNADLNSDGNVDAIDLNTFHRYCDVSNSGKQP